ncbi:DNA cytosine methyltransferase [Clostridium perfringens]|uniref:DNA cytosine methyltransferase n=1 Tax=Clostridium perfringens TaxID=1502 RepID=UPI0039EAF07A
MIFRKGELFCGPGGLALGAKNATVSNEKEKFIVEHAWANDIDYAACRTFAKNICNSDEEAIITNEDEINKEKTIICKDIRKLDISKLPPIDAFTFGFPCNDFSIVGEQKGFKGEYGPLYTYGVKVLNEHKPKWFLAENVGGLQSANEGLAFKKIIEDLASVGADEFGGYEIVPHLYKFEEYGVPQARHRVIIVGIRKDLGLHYRVPAPITKEKSKYKSSKWAFEVGCYNEGNVINAEYNNERTKHPELTVKRLEAIPAGQNAWYEGIPEELRLNVKGAKLSNIYKRLDPNTPAYTVTGSGGGGTHMYHYDEPRALTNRERARLQSFPDDYNFQGKKEEVRKQIGMAVPPIGAKIIIESILKTFAGIEYPYIEPRWDIDEIRDIT